jgi:hypothetical protein
MSYTSTIAANRSRLFPSTNHKANVYSNNYTLSKGTFSNYNAYGMSTNKDKKAPETISSNMRSQISYNQQSNIIRQPIEQIKYINSNVREA